MRSLLSLAIFGSTLAVSPVSSQHQDPADDKIFTSKGTVDDRTAPPGGQVSAPKTKIEGGPIQVSVVAADDREIEQVHPLSSRRVATSQVMRDSPAYTNPRQLGKAERSARGVEALSTRSEGRQTAIVRVGGNDRCDARSATSGSAMCMSVIETRSAEYQASTPPTLSPEQRLMVDQEGAEIRSVRGAVDRVGRNEIDANATETQTLAAITMAAPIENRPSKTTALPTGDVIPSDDAALNAIAQILGSAQGALEPK